jgi:hypothetical protein
MNVVSSTVNCSLHELKEIPHHTTILLSKGCLSLLNFQWDWIGRLCMDLRLWYKPHPTNIFNLEDNQLLMAFQCVVVIKQMSCFVVLQDFRLWLLGYWSTSNDPGVVNIVALTIMQALFMTNLHWKGDWQAVIVRVSKDIDENVTMIDAWPDFRRAWSQVASHARPP